MKSNITAPKTSYPYSHRQEVQTILHDLIDSQSFFLDVLARAVQNDFIRCLQWSFDGKCVCVDKTQLIAEFNTYFNLNSTVKSSSEFYNQLTSRLLENHFQLATSFYILPAQIICYFHPSFNKSTYNADIQLLSPTTHTVANNNPRTILPQSPFYISPNQFPCSNTPYLPNRFTNGQMRFGHFDFFPNYSVRSGSVHDNVRFKGSPIKPFHIQKQGASRFGIKVVPLSFFHPFETTTISSDLKNDETMDTESTDEYSEDLVDNDETVGEPSTKKSKISMQHKILDFFFNPRREKQNYVSSWLDSCCNYEQPETNNVWHSAVLMPSGAKKKYKNLKSTSQSNFAIENSHLVDVFGNAYINWKQLRHRVNGSSVLEAESSGLLRFNYSSLYNERTLRDIESASREEEQVKAAVETIR